MNETETLDFYVTISNLVSLKREIEDLKVESNSANRIKIAITDFRYDKLASPSGHNPNNLRMSVRILDVGRGLDEYTRTGSSLLNLINELDGSRVTLQDLQHSLFLIRAITGTGVDIVGRVNVDSWDEILRAHGNNDTQAKIWVETLVGLKNESI